VRLACFGTYFDIPLLRNVCQKYQIQFPFSGSVIDIKSMAILWLSLAGYKTSQSNLETIVRTLNLEFDGHHHRALVDADITVKILQKIHKDLANGFFLDTNNASKKKTYIALEQKN